MSFLAMVVGLAMAAPAAATRQYDACFEKAGAHFGINPLLLRAIARQESNFNPRARNTANFNDSEDRGLMQINSFWFPTLRRAGIDPESLWDPCTSITVGAWILAGEIRQHGMTWEAVGRYNARTPEKKRIYAAKIQRNLVQEMRDAGMSVEMPRG
jgi:soluble lytic murein transglycosylase-like protein